MAPSEFGGLEEVVIRLCGGLRRRGNRVGVVSVSSDSRGPPAFNDALETEGVEVHPVICPGRRYAREVAQVRDLVEEIRPDVLHTHGYRADVLHSRAARTSRTPLVTTLHGFTYGGAKNRLYEWLQVRSVRSYDAVVAVSQPLATYLEAHGVRETALHVLQNAWRPRAEPESPAAARAELGIPSEAFHVAWVGRLSGEKGPDLFLAALRLLPVSDSMRASILGDGPMRSELKTAARGFGDAVRFHGIVPNAGRLFPGFDALVLTSRTEGTPMVLFEAMSAQVPIVATAVGGVPDVIDSRTAILVPPDDAKALANGIRAVREDREGAAVRAREARARLLERFSEGPWIEAYARVYDSVRRVRTPDSVRR